MDKTEQFKKIIIPIKNDIEIFEKDLKNVLNKYKNFLSDDLNLFMFSKPKRLRPIFIFMFSKILNIKDTKLVQEIALVVEILHNASLIHDDIIDCEEIRRSNPTFYKKYGSKLAVLEGDLLLSLALEILGNTNIEIVKIFSKRILKTINGEIEQNSILNTIPEEEKYYNKTLEKTGNLFIAGIEAILTLDHFNKDIKDNLINFMKNYTLAFQIKNDIENIKYNNSTDFKNGNYTLPVLYFCLANNFKDLKQNSEEFNKCLLLSEKKVRELKESAINYLQMFENTIYKQALIDICNYTLRSEN